MYNSVPGIDTVDRPREAKCLEVLVGNDGPARGVGSTDKGETARLEEFFEAIGCDGLGVVHLRILNLLRSQNDGMRHRLSYPPVLPILMILFARAK